MEGEIPSVQLPSSHSSFSCVHSFCDVHDKNGSEGENAQKTFLVFLHCGFWNRKWSHKQQYIQFSFLRNTDRQVVQTEVSIIYKWL